jgi:hypothetical protein
VARVVLIADGSPCDVFELVELSNGVVKARAPFLFELGEQLSVRIEDNGTVREATVRVRAHVGGGDDRVTELEIVTSGEPRTMVTG